MPTEIAALQCIFEHDPTHNPHFCSTREGGNELQRICRDVAGNHDALVGLYVVKSVDPADQAQGLRYDPAMHGRVVALVRVLPMPAGRSIHDYPSGVPKYDRHFNKVDRWPVGWPSETVFFSGYGGPFLDVACYRTGFDFVGLTHQFLQGPIDLRRRAFQPLRQQLLLEARHQAMRQPATVVSPF